MTTRPSPLPPVVLQVKRGYMHMIRRHKLLRRLLLKLTHDVQQQQQAKSGSSSKVLTLRDVWEPVPGSNEYLPLQLYRMVRSRQYSAQEYDLEYFVWPVCFNSNALSTNFNAAAVQSK